MTAAPEVTTNSPRHPISVASSPAAVESAEGSSASVMVIALINRPPSCAPPVPISGAEHGDGA